MWGCAVIRLVIYKADMEQTRLHISSPNISCCFLLWNYVKTLKGNLWRSRGFRNTKHATNTPHEKQCGHLLNNSGYLSGWLYLATKKIWADLFYFLFCFVLPRHATEPCSIPITKPSWQTQTKLPNVFLQVRRGGHTPASRWHSSTSARQHKHVSQATPLVNLGPLVVTFLKKKNTHTQLNLSSPLCSKQQLPSKRHK